MAKIPMGNFGNALPEVQETHLPQNNLNELGRALGNVSGVLAQKAQQVKIQQTKDDHALLATQTAKATSDINLIDSDLTAQVQSGHLSMDAAVKQRTTNIQDIVNQHAKDVPSSQLTQFKQWGDLASYKSAEKYFPVAQQAQEKQNVVILDQMIDQGVTVGNKDQLRTLATTYAQSKNIPLAQVEQKLAKANNQVDQNNITMLFNGSLEDNNALTKNFGDIDGIQKQYPNMTKEQAIYWNQKSLNRIDQNNKAADMAQKRAEADAKDAVSEMRQIAETGFVPSDQKVQELSGRTQGTAQQGDFKNLADNLVEVQKFMRMPPDARQSYLSKMETDAHDTVSDDPKSVSFRLGLLKSANNNMLSNEKNNPTLAYSIKTGRDLPVVPTTLIAQGDAKSLATLGENIKSITAMHQAGGVTGSVNPLTTQQQQEMKQFISTANPNQKLQLATNLLKSSAGNANASRDMIQSVFGSSNTTYRWAAALNSRGLKDISGQISAGQDLLDKHLVKVNDTSLVQKSTEYLKGITSPGKPDFNIYLDAVKANYAYLAQKSEKLTDRSGKLDTKNIDDDLFKQAVINVTGGKYTSGSYGSKSVVLRPHTVGEKEFGDQLDAFNSINSRTYGGSDRDYFKDLPLEQDPSNPYRYYFKNGSGYVMDQTDPKRQTRLALTLH